MKIDFLQRHLAVTSRIGAQQLVTRDRGFWNVVSICSPTTRRADLPGAKRIHAMLFEDVESASDPDAIAVPRREDLAAVFRFADETGEEPLLVHCQLGLSRSAAVALVLMVRKLWPAPDAFDRAAQALLEIRPQARPNVLIAETGFALFMAAEAAHQLAVRVANHAAFSANRAATSNHARQPPSWF